jgi:hypothetical protein
MCFAEPCESCRVSFMSAGVTSISGGVSCVSGTASGMAGGFSDSSNEFSYGSGDTSCVGASCVTRVLGSDMRTFLSPATDWSMNLGILSN